MNALQQIKIKLFKPKAKEVTTKQTAGKYVKTPNKPNKPPNDKVENCESMLRMCFFIFWFFSRHRLTADSSRLFYEGIRISLDSIDPRTMFVACRVILRVKRKGDNRVARIGH